MAWDLASKVALQFNLPVVLWIAILIRTDYKAYIQIMFWQLSLHINNYLDKRGLSNWDRT